MTLFWLTKCHFWGITFIESSLDSLVKSFIVEKGHSPRLYSILALLQDVEILRGKILTISAVRFHFEQFVSTVERVFSVGKV